MKDSVLNKYCWISSTFTLPKHFEGTLNQDFIHHGVGPAVEDDEKIYHQYYQWVPLVLSLQVSHQSDQSLSLLDIQQLEFQAAMFYLPHWIWKVAHWHCFVRTAEIIRFFFSAIGRGQIGTDHSGPQYGRL